MNFHIHIRLMVLVIQLLPVVVFVLLLVDHHGSMINAFHVGFGGGFGWITTANDRRTERMYYYFSTSSTRTQQYASTSKTSSDYDQQEAQVGGGQAADWIIEGLDDAKDDEESSLTRPASTERNGTEALAIGENDYIPIEGLHIGKHFHIISTGVTNTNGVVTESNKNDNKNKNNNEYDTIQIKLLSRANGWGSGVHPTTRLCLEFLEDIFLNDNDKMLSSDNDDNDNDLVVLDYGCGSGILSIASLKLGATHVVGVDIDAEALVTCYKNLQLNGYTGSSNDDDEVEDYNDNNEQEQQQQQQQTFQLLHTRQIQPFDLSYPEKGSAHVCVANILIGQLVRPSMVAALVSNIHSTKGIICFSGIRPNEVNSLKTAYNEHLDWIDYNELDASETKFSKESYGFDVGTWVRVVGRIKPNHTINSRQLSELAIQ